MTDPSPPSPVSPETVEAIRERLEVRILGLVDRGIHICADFISRPHNDGGLSQLCLACGYGADVHLMRDALSALASAHQRSEQAEREIGELVQSVQARESERNQARASATLLDNDNAALAALLTVAEQRAEQAELSKQTIKIEREVCKALPAAEPSLPVSRLRAMSAQWKRDADENRRHGERYVAEAYLDCAADLDRLLATVEP